MKKRVVVSLILSSMLICATAVSASAMEACLIGSPRDANLMPRQMEPLRISRYSASEINVFLSEVLY